MDFAAGATQNVTLDFTIPSSYNMEHLELIVFIQDNTTMEVLQGSFAELVTGVDDILNENEVYAYPNPATDLVNVKSDVQINTVKVFNYAGQIKVNEVVNSMMYQLNTSQYQSGIYFFRIETDEGTISKRIIIQ